MTGQYHHNMDISEKRIVWLAGLSLFLATLDTGIINMALPTLQAVWLTSAPVVAWTVAAYTVTLAGTVLFWGRLADRMGSESILLVGLIVFGGASALCGAAPSLAILIGARALQGLGSGMVQGTAAAFVSTRIDSQRHPLAFGTLAMFQGLGPVIGPTVGGAVLTWLSWRWLFWINIPVMVPLTAMLWARHPHRPPRATISLDGIGNAFLMITVTAGILALAGNAGSRSLWGLLTILMSGAFIAWERRASYPLIARALWGMPAFWAAALAVIAAGGATALGFMVPPYTLRLFDHLPLWEVGVVNITAPLALVLFSRRIGRLLSRFTASQIMGVGLVMMAGAFLALACSAVTGSPLVMIPWLLCYGIGAAAFFPSNLAAMLASAGREHQGILGALQRMGINLGIALDVTVTGIFLNIGAHADHPISIVGVHEAWAYGAVTLMGAAVGVWITRRRKPLQE